MASKFDVYWLYPPNWNGFVPDKGGWKRVTLRLTGDVDVLGETQEVKLDLSALQCTSGQPVLRTVVEKIRWSCLGAADTVKLEWDRTPKQTIAILSRSGNEDYTKQGGLVDPGGGGTGDILLTCTDSYDITLQVKLKDS